MAVRNFTVNGTEVAIRAGDRVLFDGNWVTFPGQEPEEMPQVRGAITAGWLVPEPAKPATATAQVLVDDKPVGKPFKIPKPTPYIERPTRYTILGYGGLDLEDE